ncbi:MAG: low temperature requirement protein A, partial [Actinobacteria bacterium]|nr:low temperature requirement protein A [Actinomycetota bacterium]
MSRADERTGRAGLTPMRPRDPSQVFRASRPLELFFDLVFVVAVSLASAQLHESLAHALEAGTGPAPGLISYLMVFFAIWWAWMNFTWFASAFDVDDWLYRLLTLVQMAGVLVLAVGIRDASEGDFGTVVIAYIVMRLALVAQWLRASRSHPELRRTALRYAGGVGLVQLLWVGFLLIPAPASTYCFLLFALCELAVPVWAESARQTPWHPEHIADRYGSFTLIVLGESVLASTTAVAQAVGDTHHILELAAIGFCGLALAAGMWWLYFATEVNDRLERVRTALPFGYGHYAVFAAAGAFSAGISVLLGSDPGGTDFASIAAAATLTVPVAVFIIGVWLLIMRHRLTGATRALVPVGAVLIALCALLPWSIVWAAVVMF